MTSTVTSEGQVTIPEPVRRLLGLEPGSAVEFEVEPDGRIVMVKADAARPADRFARLRGHAGRTMTTDEIMALTRGEG